MRQNEIVMRIRYTDAAKRRCQQKHANEKSQDQSTSFVQSIDTNDKEYCKRCYVKVHLVQSDIPLTRNIELLVYIWWYNPSA